MAVWDQEDIVRYLITCETRWSPSTSTTSPGRMRLFRRSGSLKTKRRYSCRGRVICRTNHCARAWCGERTCSLCPSLVTPASIARMSAHRMVADESAIGAGRRRQPPGPRGGLLLGNLRAFAADVPGFLTRCTREYGDTIFLRLPGHDVFVLNRPEDIESVLLTQRANFVKHSFFWRHVTAIFGTGLLPSEGEFWLRRRRLAAPAFHPDRIAAYADVMTAYAERQAAGWRDGEVREIHGDMMRVTMEIVSKTLFDVEVEEDVDEIGRSFDLVIREIARRFRRPVKIADWIPLPGNLRYRRGVALLDRLVARVLAERRARPGD